MNICKRGLSAALALTLAASLTACGGDTSNTSGSVSGSGEENKELEKITFVLDWTPNTNHTGVYVAIDQGYFEEAGLEVEVVQPPEDGAEVLVASSKAQFGVSFQDYIAPGLIGEDPLPITAVAAVLQHNTSGIISRQGEGMDTPKGLEGHKYATWDLDVEKATIQQVGDNRVRVGNIHGKPRPDTLKLCIGYHKGRYMSRAAREFIRIAQERIPHGDPGR